MSDRERLNPREVAKTFLFVNIHRLIAAAVAFLVYQGIVAEGSLSQSAIKYLATILAYYVVDVAPDVARRCYAGLRAKYRFLEALEARSTDHPEIVKLRAQQKLQDNVALVKFVPYQPLALLLSLSLFLAPLAGCTKSQFQKMQSLSSKASIALSGASVLVDSLVRANLISPDEGDRLLGEFDAFSAPISQADAILQKLTQLTAEGKLKLKELLAIALAELDAFEAGNSAFLPAGKASDRVARIVKLVRELVRGVLGYLDRINLAHALSLSTFERKVKELEELMRPVNFTATA